MQIKMFITMPPVMIAEDASVEEAATLMKHENVGCVIVVKNQNADITPRGIITDRDIVMHLLANRIDSWKVSVKDIMSTDLLTLKAEQDIHEAIQAMSQRGVRRAPVLNDTGGAIGLISLDDILPLLIGELAEIANLINKQKK